MDNPYAAPKAQILIPKTGEAIPLTWNEILFSFKGRIPRRTYWRFSILVSLLYTAVNLPIYAMMEESVADAIGWVLYVPFLYVIFAIAAKRWHDRDKSAWWNLFSMIPILGTIWSLVECGFLRGTEGPNKYGDDPT